MFPYREQYYVPSLSPTKPNPDFGAQASAAKETDRPTVPADTQRHQLPRPHASDLASFYRLILVQLHVAPSHPVSQDQRLTL